MRSISDSACQVVGTGCLAGVAIATGVKGRVVAGLDRGRPPRSQQPEDCPHGLLRRRRGGQKALNVANAIRLASAIRRMWRMSRMSIT